MELRTRGIIYDLIYNVTKNGFEKFLTQFYRLEFKATFIYTQILSP